MYETATGLKHKDKDVRLASFLCIIGKQGQQKYESFQFSNEEDREDIEKVIELFKKDCEARSNIIIERHKFLSRKQQPTETIDQYLTNLNLLLGTCEY